MIPFYTVHPTEVEKPWLISLLWETTAIGQSVAANTQLRTFTETQFGSLFCSFRRIYGQFCECERSVPTREVTLFLRGACHLNTLPAMEVFARMRFNNLGEDRTRASLWLSPVYIRQDGTAMLPDGIANETGVRRLVESVLASQSKTMSEVLDIASLVGKDVTFINGLVSLGIIDIVDDVVKPLMSPSVFRETFGIPSCLR